MCNTPSCNNVNQTLLQTKLPPLLAIPPTISAIADSGATTNLLRQSSARVLQNDPVQNSITVALPNNQSIKSLHSGNLLHHVHENSLPAYTFSDCDLQHNLISLSSMTNIGCQVVLTNTAIDITLNDQLVYHGCKRPMDTLWLIDIDKLQLGFEPVSHTASLTIKYDTDAELVAFIHATFGSPPLSTFLHAARQGWLDHIPRITASMIAAIAPNTLATAMGYPDQTRQVKKSTRPQSLYNSTSFSSSQIDELMW